MFDVSMKKWLRNVCCSAKMESRSHKDRNKFVFSRVRRSVGSAHQPGKRRVDMEGKVGDGDGDGEAHL